jgi:hypothetical protein
MPNRHSSWRGNFGARPNCAQIAGSAWGVPVYRQSPVEDGYFAHAIPGEIDSPRTRPAVASEMRVI